MVKKQKKKRIPLPPAQTIPAKRKLEDSTKVTDIIPKKNDESFGLSGGNRKYGDERLELQQKRQSQQS